MKAIYDCLAVGAGPVGGVCAYELAKKGLKVLIRCSEARRSSERG